MEMRQKTLLSTAYSLALVLLVSGAPDQGETRKMLVPAWKGFP